MHVHFIFNYVNVCLFLNHIMTILHLYLTYNQSGNLLNRASISKTLIGYSLKLNDPRYIYNHPQHRHSTRGLAAWLLALVLALLSFILWAWTVLSCQLLLEMRWQAHTYILTVIQRRILLTNSLSKKALLFTTLNVWNKGFNSHR